MVIDENGQVGNVYKSSIDDRVSNWIAIVLVWVCMIPVIVIVAGLISYLPFTVLFELYWLGIPFHLLLCVLGLYYLYRFAKKHLLFTLELHEDYVFVDGVQIAYDKIDKICYFHKSDGSGPMFNYYYFEIYADSGQYFRVLLRGRHVADAVLADLEKNHGFFKVDGRQKSFLGLVSPFRLPRAEYRRAPEGDSWIISGE